MNRTRSLTAGAIISAAIVSVPLLVAAGSQPNGQAAMNGTGHCDHAMIEGNGSWGSLYRTHGPKATVGHWHAIHQLDLSDDQRREIDGITAEFHDRLRDLQSRRQQAASELPPLYAAEEADPKAIGAVYAELFDAKRERIEAVIDAKNRLLGALTDEQRALLEGAEDNA